MKKMVGTFTRLIVAVCIVLFCMVNGSFATMIDITWAGTVGESFEMEELVVGDDWYLTAIIDDVEDKIEFRGSWEGQQLAGTHFDEYFNAIHYDVSDNLQHSIDYFLNLSSIIERIHVEDQPWVRRARVEIFHELNGIDLHQLYIPGDESANGILFTGGGMAILNIESVRFTNNQPVPEPATMLLFGTGLAGLAGYRKRQAKMK